MAGSGQKDVAPLCAESTSASARSELIKLIKHPLHEPLGPTLLVPPAAQEKRFRRKVSLLFGCSSAVSKKKYAPSENC
jgi:hypothetical protein